MSGKVVVVGSLSLDFVMRVPRRPQKGETLAGFDFNTFVGGKGNNQALAAARAGASVTMIGRVGVDPYGELLLKTLQGDKVDVSSMIKDKKAGTGIANIYIDPEGDNSIVIVQRANANLCAADVQNAEGTILDAKVVLMQMEVPNDAIQMAAEIGQRANAIVILNPAPAPPSGRLPDGLLPYVDLIIPNQTELEILTGIPANDREGAIEGAKKLQKMGVDQVIVTMGEQGALFVNADGEHEFVTSFAVKAVDTTAAGDAFCGALAAALAADIPVDQAIRLGCAAGALATTRPGAEPSLPTLMEIRQLMASSSRA